MQNPIDMIYQSAIICIGNELLLGRTVNSNLAWLGRQLADLGMPVAYSETIPDEPAAIQEALEYCWQKYDLVITTGGLGPTQDDITKAVIAEFFNKDLHFDEEVWEHIQQMFSRRGVKMPDSNRSQAMVPDGFAVLNNMRGTAPGLHYEASGKHFFALQGVPAEMKYIYETHIKGILQAALPDSSALLVRNIHTYGVAESALAELLNLNCLPEGVMLAWLPQTGRVDLRIYGSEAKALAVAEAYVLEQCKQYVWGYDEDTPAGNLLRLLKSKNYSISLAESCTGGLVQKLITDVAGASEYFLGGLVSYSNRIKQELLKVQPEILEKYGAVSSQCVQSMAGNVQQLFGSDVSLAISGIAGPGGGTPDKPVGTVYLSWCIKEKQYDLHKVFTGDREQIRLKAAEAAILELLNSLQEI